MNISSILFIDPSVSNYEILVSSAIADVKSIVLAPNKDGVAQITETLRQYSGVESVHIISHGSPGTLYVGNSELSLSTLKLYADQLKNWFSPSDSPHLLLYGCNVAAGDAGYEFITKLHQLTGANIAASANLTGNVVLGGDWNLEVNIGNNSNQPLALSAEAMAAYPSVLISIVPRGNVPSSSYAFGIDVKDNYAYVADTAAGLKIIDITDPANPILEGSYDTSGTAYEVVVVGNYAYIADEQSGLQIVDITDPANPTLTGSYNVSKAAYDVAVVRNYAYVADNEAGLQIVDITDPANPTLTGSSPISNAYDVAVVGNSAYVTALEGLQIVDITDPANPTLKATYDTPNFAQGVTVVGNYAYVADDNTLEIIDISNPENPNPARGTYSTTPGYANDVTVVGNNAYVADYNAGVQILDISNPTSPTLVGSYDSSGFAEDVAVVGKFIYIADGNQGLQILENNNTPPTAANKTLTINPDSVYTFAATDFNFADADTGDSLKAVQVTQLPPSGESVGQFFQDDNNNDTQDSGEAIGVNQTIALADVGKLKFIPAINPSNSNYAFQFKVSDGIEFSAFAYTIDAEIDRINNAPVLSDTAVTLAAINKGTGAPTGTVGTLVSSLVKLGAGGNVTDLDAGALTGIAITNANTTNGSFFFSIDDGTTWTALGAVSDSNALLLAANDNTRLYFQPNANSSGTINDVITFRAWDRTTGSNGNKINITAVSGSTAFSTTTDTAAITINESIIPNSAPTLTNTNVILSAVSEDAGAPTGAVGTLVSSLLSLGGNVTDPDPGAAVGIAITNADTSNGSFFYSTNNGTTWKPLEAVSNNSALLLAADDKTRIYFQPNANSNGSINDVLTFRAWDQTTGSNGNKVDANTNGGNTAFSSATDTASIIVENANTPLSLKLLSNNLDLFQLQGVSDSADKPKLEVTLAGFKSRQVNELGVFIVDDDQGRINGITPGANGYAQAALAKSKVIFSAISDVPNGFDTNLSSLLEFNSGDRFRFLLVKDSTIDSVLNGKTSFSEVLFSDTQTAKVTDLGNQGYTLAFKDALNSNTADFQDVVVRVKPTDRSLPLGAGLQGNPMAELIDLRNVKTQVKAEFVLNREAAFDNFVGFYRLADVNGGIDTDGNGTVDFRPGDAGYTEAAVRGRVPGIDLTVSNQGTATFTGTFEPGSLLAPFIIANGRPEAVLDNDARNNPAVYFPFLGANSDQTDRVRLLGNNTFGFEDLPNGGDNDYNDVTVKVKLSVA